MHGNDVCPRRFFLEIGLCFPPLTDLKINTAHENLLASVLGYTGLPKDVQCASKERGEESNIKKETLFFVFLTCLCKDRGKCPLYFTSRIYFFHLIMMFFAQVVQRNLRICTSSLKIRSKAGDAFQTKNPIKLTPPLKLSFCPRYSKPLVLEKRISW